MDVGLPSENLVIDGGAMNAQHKTLVIGGLVGGLLGIFAAWLYLRTVREEETVSPQAIPPGRMVKLGLSILEVLRQVVALSEQEREGGRRRWLRGK